ncbi:MAG: hypothetical protein WCE46_00810 [Methanoregula sp.]|jgi:hypothetical protein|uniref:hypothetical protein n=1 Tax=Methanoregula sp. TaxID=2052170 RepID=UPI003C77A3A0
MRVDTSGAVPRTIRFSISSESLAMVIIVIAAIELGAGYILKRKQRWGKEKQLLVFPHSATETGSTSRPDAGNIRYPSARIKKIAR